MELSEIARLNVKKDSELYNTMIGNHLESCLQQKETKSNSHHNTKIMQRHTKTCEKKV